MRTLSLISYALLATALLFVTGRGDQRVKPVEWEEDLTAARALARKTGKPLFVVFRCERCECCAGFDQQVLQPEDRALVELQKQFVCVRILRMDNVDIGFFKFDYDLTWMGFFLDADNRIYGRYGGRDEKGDEERMTVDGLKFTMQRILDLHRQPPADMAALPAPHQPQRPSDLFKIRTDACLHCHQIWEGLRDRDRARGTFDPASLYVYPLPENIGLELDVNAGTKVVKVLPDSPASRAKLQPGDAVRRINGVRISSQGDVQWALHNAPATGTITVEVAREGKDMSAVLALADGWRKTDLSWRQSILKEAKYIKDN